MEENKNIVKIVRKISLFYLIFLSIFFLGYIVREKELWPYKTIQETKNYLENNGSKNLSLSKKISNDIGGEPYRYIVDYKYENIFNLDFTPIEDLPLKSERDKPEIFIAKDALQGYRIIYGTFDFLDNLHGAIMLAPDGKLAHIWKLSQENDDWTNPSDFNVYPHGFHIFEDGSIIASFNRGAGLIKYNYCNEIEWKIKGDFHHSISVDNQGNIWTWGEYGATKPVGEIYYNYTLLNIDSKNKQLIKKISILDIIKANPDIDIFEVVQTDFDSIDESNWLDESLGGSWHGNDIEPLSKELAGKYSKFKADDLLISLRSPDLIFVMDPNTLKVKWWIQGLTRRQHDADWNDRGTITVLNNNMDKGMSSIYEINPNTYEYKKIVDGEKYNFYTHIKGNHQLLPNGNILISSNEQGRVFEVDKDGNIDFEFLNLYNKKEGQFLEVSDAVFFEKDFENNLPKCN